MRYLTQRAFDAMKQDGRLQDNGNGIPYIRIQLPEPGGAHVDEPVTVRETDTFCWEPRRNGTPWVYIGKDGQWPEDVAAKRCPVFPHITGGK